MEASADKVEPITPAAQSSGADERSPLPSVEGPDAGIEALRVLRHDFKTPLTSLKMLAQVFKLGVEKGTLATQSERTERNCRMLVEQVDKLVDLADNLYEISLAQSGRLQLQRQLADLRPVLTNALNKFEAKVRSVQMPEQPVWGEWDTQRLFQAFSHLLDEAESVDVVLTGQGATCQLMLKGDFRDVTGKTAPGRYLARFVITAHGGRLDNRFEVTLPLVSRQ